MGIGNNTNQTTNLPNDYRAGLVFLNVLVFLGGSMGVGMISTILKSNMLSITTVSVINLLVVHVIFLLTVPFRIYYYANNSWNLGLEFCKLVSSMIHAHMYLSFIFYVIILLARYLAFFEWGHRLEFYRALHAVIASVLVWAIVVGTALPTTILTYGSGMAANPNVCFYFGGTLMNRKVQSLNYVICVVILLVWTALSVCQLYILWKMYKKYGRTSSSHQEFRVQIKSMFFVIIMFLCFVPYHVFRMYYVSNYDYELEKSNEVFLTFTAFSCFDLLIFAGRSVWEPVYTKCCFR